MVEPIPETTEAIEEYGPFVHDVDLLAELRTMGARVTGIVPECVGLSVAYREHGVTFTLVASDEDIAALDGLQYLDGGPCVTVVEQDTGILAYSAGDPLAEDTWQLFCRGTAAHGISSTLSLPIMAGDTAVGSFNLYAAAPHAFAGKHDEVAAALGAWAPGAVANADLGFQTRRTAQRAPDLLFEETRLQVALGFLVASMGVTTTEARERLREAAERAGVSEIDLAKVIIEQATYPGPDTDDA